MSGDSTDPTVVRSIAVTADDVVTAVEATVTSGRRTVLRVTPPFSGRMRARLHVPQGDEAGAVEPRPIHVDPTSLLAEDAPPLPQPDDTAAAVREDPDAEYSVHRHRERHVRAMDGWRRAVPAYIVDSVVLQLPDRAHEVDVTVLGYR